MKYKFLQFFICTLIPVFPQIVTADDLDDFDPKDAELNLLKEEESFLSDLLDGDKELEEVEKTDIKKDFEDSKAKSKDVTNIKNEEPIKNVIPNKTTKKVNKPTPPPTRVNEVSLKEKELKKSL